MAARVSKTSVRSRQAVTTRSIAEQAVTTKQSTESVQILITSAVCTISFLRALFPERCFTDRQVGHGQDRLDYSELSDQSTRQRAGRELEEERPGANMKLLRKGSSQRVDKLFDILVRRIAQILALIDIKANLT